jgi:hypothetical protein
MVNERAELTDGEVDGRAVGTSENCGNTHQNPDTTIMYIRLNGLH